MDSVEGNQGQRRSGWSKELKWENLGALKSARKKAMEKRKKG